MNFKRVKIYSSSLINLMIFQKLKEELRAEKIINAKILPIEYSLGLPKELIKNSLGKCEFKRLKILDKKELTVLDFMKSPKFSFLI